jgi:hypothetical protein
MASGLRCIESYLPSSSGAKLNNDSITVPSTVPISATSHTHYAVKVYSSLLTSTVYECMLCIERHSTLKPPHGVYKPASQEPLPLRSSQRSLMTTFPYLISPSSQSSGAELADARDIVSWITTVTSGILCHERFQVYEDVGRFHPWHPNSSLSRPAY